MTDDVPYHETVTMWLLTASGGVLAAVGVHRAIGGALALGVILVPTGLALVWYSRATYVVSDDQLTATMGYGWPRLVINAGHLVHAEPSSPSFLTTGGWGYRGSWTLSNSVIISLGGRGKVMFRTDAGKRLTVSTNHPTQLIAAAEALIARGRSTDPFSGT
jgi:hypothetical protein